MLKIVGNIGVHNSVDNTVHLYSLYVYIYIYHETKWAIFHSKRFHYQMVLKGPPYLAKLIYN